MCPARKPLASAVCGVWCRCPVAPAPRAGDDRRLRTASLRRRHVFRSNTSSFFFFFCTAQPRIQYLFLFFDLFIFVFRNLLIIPNGVFREIPRPGVDLSVYEQYHQSYALDDDTTNTGEKNQRPTFQINNSNNGRIF